MHENTGIERENLPLCRTDTNANGEPILKVYDVNKSAVLEESIEKYVAGVIAGEMKKLLADRSAESSGNSRTHVRSEIL